jgi:hypothetical protein
VPTVLYLLILQRTGSIDWHAAAASYLGVFLVGASYLSIGLLMSAITKSQFLALIGTAMIILALFILGIGEFVTREGTAIHEICAYVSVWGQMNEFSTGIVDSRRLVYDSSLIVVHDARRRSLAVGLSDADDSEEEQRKASKRRGIIAFLELVAFHQHGPRRRARRRFRRDAARPRDQFFGRASLRALGLDDRQTLFAHAADVANAARAEGSGRRLGAARKR